MKPESGRTRGSKADPQICLQRVAGSISVRTMLMTFFIFFFCWIFCRFFEQCVFFVPCSPPDKSSLCVSHCIPSHQTITICSPFEDLPSPIANFSVRHICPLQKASSPRLTPCFFVPPGSCATILRVPQCLGERRKVQTVAPYPPHHALLQLFNL